MVTGGHSWKFDSTTKHSTEIFSDNVWRTVTAKLPFNGLMDLRITTINNRVLTFGNPLFLTFELSIFYVFLKVDVMLQRGQG